MAHDSGIPDAIPFRTAGPVPGGVKALLAILVLIGAAAAFLAAGDPYRLWPSLLFNWLFWSSVAMGMVMFAVALRITNAGWAWSIRRFALGGVAFLPISFVLLAVVMLGYEVYFHHWLHAEGDPVIEAKAAWLNLPALLTRDFLGLVVLYGMAIAFAYFQLRPDVYGVEGPRRRPIYDRITGNWRGVREEAKRSYLTAGKIAPVLAILYAVIWGAFIGVDLGMSLQPHWFSTMYPVAFFWTAFHGGVAATILAVVVFRGRARLREYVTARQFHDLGKLLFAFSVFWMYLNWSQYIVIWYGLLPWEQEFFVKRFEMPFGYVAEAVVLMVFVLPFFGLLTRPPKKIPAILGGFAALILVGHWLERFLLIYPALWEEHGVLPLGLPEIGIALGFLGLFVGSYLWFVSTFPLLPSPVSLAAEDSPLVTVPVTARS